MDSMVSEADILALSLQMSKMQLGEIEVSYLESG